MKYTNALGLPAPLVRVLSQDRKPAPPRISVTELISPPQIYALKIKHWDEITIEVADRGYILLGNVAHYLAQQGAGPGDLAEQRLDTEIGGWTLTGQSDLYEDVFGVDGDLLTDYKTTGVGGMYSMKAGWVAQVNVYAWLWAQAGYEVKRLQIVPIYRDWMHGKAHGDYPPHPIGAPKPVARWPAGQTIGYIKDQLADKDWYKEGPELTRDCTPEERWQRPTQYAVTPVGRKRARRVLDSAEEAEEWAEDNPPKNKKAGNWYEISERPGKDVRCEDGWCEVAFACPQLARARAAEVGVLP